jgi:hypothetical protein
MRGMSIREKIKKFGNGTKNLSTKGKGELECLICHGNFNNLGAHVYRAHNITGKNYIVKFNLPKNSLMASHLKLQLSKRMLVDGIEMNKKAIPKIRDFWKSEKSIGARKLMSENMKRRMKTDKRLTDNLKKINMLKKQNANLNS